MGKRANKSKNSIPRPINFIVLCMAAIKPMTKNGTLDVKQRVVII